MAAHIIIWLLVYCIVVKYVFSCLVLIVCDQTIFRFSNYTETILARLCLFLPTILYFVVIVGEKFHFKFARLFLQQYSGLSINGIALGSTEEPVLQETIEKVPQDFWTDIKVSFNDSNYLRLVFSALGVLSYLDYYG